MTAVAVDQDAAQAHLTHLAERDLERRAICVRRRVAADRAGHPAIETRHGRESNCRLLVVRSARELLRVVGVKKRSVQRQLNWCAWKPQPSMAGLDFGLMGRGKRSDVIQRLDQLW